MVKGLYTAYTGMLDEQRRLDVLANNLANVSTTGYKNEALVPQSFDQQLAIKIKDTSEPGHKPVTIGGIVYGVKMGETYTDWTQGGLQITDNESDLAISGNGFFAIEFTNKAGQTSIKYTRDGNFVVDSQGYIRTVDGDYLLNEAGALGSQSGDGNRVQINPNLPYGIGSDGTITHNNQIVGKVGLVDVALPAGAPEGLKAYDYINKYGENMYDLIPGAQIVASTASLQQGCLESSNVNVVDQMVDMITIQRAYEAGQKVIQAEDSAMDKAVNDVGRV